jgi:predicted amidohydrolase
MANAFIVQFKRTFEQAEFFIDAVSGYECDFALFPEFFTAPLNGRF